MLRNNQYTAARQARDTRRHDAGRFGHHPPYQRHDGGRHDGGRHDARLGQLDDRSSSFREYGEVSDCVVNGVMIHVDWALPRLPTHTPQHFVPMTNGREDLLSKRKLFGTMWTPRSDILCTQTPQSVSRGVDSNSSIARSNNVVESSVSRSASRPTVSREVAESVSARSLEFEPMEVDHDTSNDNDDDMQTDTTKDVTTMAAEASSVEEHTSVDDKMEEDLFGQVEGDIATESNAHDVQTEGTMSTTTPPMASTTANATSITTTAEVESATTNVDAQAATEPKHHNENANAFDLVLAKASDRPKAKEDLAYLLGEGDNASLVWVKWVISDEVVQIPRTWAKAYNPGRCSALNKMSYVDLSHEQIDSMAANDDAAAIEAAEKVKAAHQLKKEETTSTQVYKNGTRILSFFPHVDEETGEIVRISPYPGKIRSYNAQTELYTVAYDDGDVLDDRSEEVVEQDVLHNLLEEEKKKNKNTKDGKYMFIVEEKGRLFYQEKKKGKGKFIIEGQWANVGSSSHHQSFKLIHTLANGEPPAVIPNEAIFHGSFKEKDVSMEERGVHLLFTEVEGDPNVLAVNGGGKNQFGSYEISGFAKKVTDGTYDSGTYKVDLLKKYTKQTTEKSDDTASIASKASASKESTVPAEVRYPLSPHNRRRG